MPIRGPIIVSVDPARTQASLDIARRKREALLNKNKQGRSVAYGNYYRLVRTWQLVESIVTEPREPRVPDLVRPEAFIEWGAASEFGSDTFRSDAGNPGGGGDDEEPERQRWTFSEVGRGWRDYKVTAIDDPDSYIIQRQATAMQFQGPGGNFRFNLAPTPPGTMTGSGQTPPAPPTLDEM